MKCTSPIKTKLGDTVGCGQCMNCRIDRKRVWTARMILESFTAKQAYFVTLTYAPEHLPINDDGLATLVPAELKEFRDTLMRKAGTFRYYSIGEYGDETFRPHYHLAIFSDLNFKAELIPEVWDKGRTETTYLVPQQMSYICGYTAKKMTKPDDDRLEGRYPEFARMSNRQGIGYYYVENLAQCYETKKGARFLSQNGDVLPYFRYKGRTHPLGNYLISALRYRLNIPQKRPDRILANPKAAFTTPPQPTDDEMVELKNRSLTREEKRKQAWHRKKLRKL